MRIPAIIVCVLILAGCGYYFLYPGKVLERRTQATLAEFDSVMTPQARGKIGEGLKKFLADDAKIHLEVNTFTLATNTDNKVSQDFDKATFIPFLDNVLFSMTDYSYVSELQDFELSNDHKTAAITFASKEWSDGPSWYGGTKVDMRFTASTACSGQMLFDNGHPRLQKADCQMHLRMVPRPGQETKFTDPDAIRQFLAH